MSLACEAVLVPQEEERNAVSALTSSIAGEEGGQKSSWLLVMLGGAGRC